MATAARRGHGEGSIYHDEANGTWVGAISLGWRPDGKRIRRKVTGRTARCGTCAAVLIRIPALAFRCLASAEGCGYAE